MLMLLSETTSIVDQYLYELRDILLQKDKLRFKHNLERLGMIAGYEISKQLAYSDHTTKTQLGTAITPILKDKIVLCTILRAGLPLQNGIHKMFDGADLAFIGAGRKPENGGEVEIDLSYVASPSLNDKTLIIADTMLATGKSLVDAHNALVQKHGKPKHTFIVSVIASSEGVKYIRTRIPEAFIVVCAVDEKLNDKYYIVPGLGDAGDLLYGPKL